MHKFTIPLILAALAFAALSFLPLSVFDIKSDKVVLATEKESRKMVETE